MATNKTEDIDHDVSEKVDTNQLEDADASEFTPAEQKSIIRRVDRRLIITTGLMFCCCLMDRNKLGAAAIAGMSKDLKLIQYRYVSCISLQVPGGVMRGGARTETSITQSIIALVFFVTYILVQPVANVLCRKFGPRVFLTTITISWGICIVSGPHLDDIWSRPLLTH